jgi:hypothetical protein
MNIGGIAGADAFVVTIGTVHDKRPGRDVDAKGLYALQHPWCPRVGPCVDRMPPRLIDRPAARTRQPCRCLRHRQIDGQSHAARADVDVPAAAEAADLQQLSVADQVGKVIGPDMAQ